jgi:hypothetical protein
MILFASRAFARVEPMAEINILERREMIEITTRSSMSVNPFFDIL